MPTSLSEQRPRWGLQQARDRETAATRYPPCCYVSTTNLQHDRESVALAIRMCVARHEDKMSEFTLVIGNRNYSSWSLRGWLICKAAGIEFEEVLVRLYEPDSKAQVARYSPSGLVPVLVQ